jgi:hypothetical protein
MTSQDNKKQNNGCLIGCGTIILVIAAFGIAGSISSLYQQNLTPQQKKEEAQRQLNEWYTQTSSFSCERIFKEQLRNPSSYERIGDFVSTNDSGSKKVVIWKYRAQNGFGGMNVGAAMCNVSKENNGTYEAKALTQ